jgi:hypothetical protein
MGNAGALGRRLWKYVLLPWGTDFHLCFPSFYDVGGVPAGCHLVDELPGT